MFLAAGIWFRQRQYGQYFEFKVLAFATLIQLIAMALVGLSGILAPSRRAELYREAARRTTSTAERDHLTRRAADLRA